MCYYSNLPQLFEQIIHKLLMDQLNELTQQRSVLYLCDQIPVMVFVKQLWLSSKQRVKNPSRCRLEALPFRDFTVPLSSSNWHKGKGQEKSEDCASHTEIVQPSWIITHQYIRFAKKCGSRAVCFSSDDFLRVLSMLSCEQHMVGMVY